MIVETINPLSLYSKVKDGLRRPGDDKTVTPIPYTEPSPENEKKIQVKLYYPEPVKIKPSTSYHGIPDAIVLHRLRSRTLRVPPLDTNARWIWARPGYQAKRKEME